MQLSNEEEDYNLSLSKFESMLKTNKVLFFDSEEFEEITMEEKGSFQSDGLKIAADKAGFSQMPEMKAIKAAGHETGDFFLVPVTAR